VSYMLIRDLEPLLRLQIAKRVRMNGPSFSDDALVLMELGLAEKRKASRNKRRTVRTGRRVVRDGA